MVVLIKNDNESRYDYHAVVDTSLPKGPRATLYFGKLADCRAWLKANYYDSEMPVIGSWDMIL